MNVCQSSSSLSCNGKTYLDSRRGETKVQPNAFSRREFKNGSRQKQDTSRKRKLELPNRRVTLKREHNFVKTVKFNKPSAKKYDSTMSSTTTLPTKKNKVCRLLRQKQIRRLMNDKNEVLLNLFFVVLEQTFIQSIFNKMILSKLLILLKLFKFNRKELPTS